MKCAFMLLKSMALTLTCTLFLSNPSFADSHLFSITSNLFPEKKNVIVTVDQNNAATGFYVENPGKANRPFTVDQMKSKGGAILDAKGKLVTLIARTKNFSATTGGTIVLTYLHNGSPVRLFDEKTAEFRFNVSNDGTWRAFAVENFPNGKKVTYSPPRTFDQMYLEKNTSSGITVGVDYITVKTL